MEVIFLCFAVVPFLAGRTTFAIGVMLAWGLVESARAQHELTPKTIVFALVASVLGTVAQVAMLTSMMRYAREQWGRFASQLKLLAVPVAAMLFASFMLSTAAPAAAVVALAGFDRNAVITIAVGITAFFFAKLRQWLASAAEVIPFVGEGKVQQAIFLAEMVTTVVGLAIVVTWPVVGFVMMVLSLLAMLAALMMLRGIQALARGPCEACGKSLHRAASVCPRCKASRVPSRIGALGRIVTGPPSPSHRLSLLTSRRCPSCAEGIRNDAGHITCPGCGVNPLGDPAEVRAFVTHVDKRALAFAPVFIAMGLVPVLGLGAALVFYRLSPAGALASYSGWQEHLGARIFKGLGLFALTLLQPIPVLGAVATAAVIGSIHVWTRRSFVGHEPTSTRETAS